MTVVGSEPLLEGQVTIDMDAKPNCYKFRKAILEEFQLKHTAALVVVKTRDGTDLPVQAYLADVITPETALSLETSLQVTLLVSKGIFPLFFKKCVYELDLNKGCRMRIFI